MEIGDVGHESTHPKRKTPKVNDKDIFTFDETQTRNIGSEEI